ncbi:MAG TPA: carboxypeptidase-like regulatory domain-containing protein [Bacteroidia bacterium]|nr:carboxypeptidase-like regulatory domain-containing protein [Bacteroidia bacterium]
MAKKNQIRLLYNIADSKMYEESKTKRGFFLQDQADFETFDTDFTDPFAANWLLAINEAEAMPADEILDDQLKQLGDAVEDAMDDCRNKFQDSKYFIEKTFPDNTSVWNEFGYDNYNDVRRVQSKMVQFMKTFFNVATKYKVQLAAKGYPQGKIDEIELLRSALDDANQQQELFIGNLPVQTQERYKKNNAAWEIMVRVCTAGKRIYKDDFGKYQRYLLPPGEESPEALSITGTVTDSVSGNPLENVLAKLMPGVIETHTAANGKYSYGGLPDGDYTVEFTLADYTPQTLPVTIVNGQAVQLNVQLVHV